MFGFRPVNCCPDYTPSIDFPFLAGDSLKAYGESTDFVPTAIITGAGGSLGRALAIGLARRNYHLMLTDTDLGCHAVAEEICSMGGVASAFVLDVTQIDAWYDLRDRLQREWPRLALLVNAAGCLAAGDFSETPPAAWRNVIEVNLVGTILGCQVMSEWMLSDEGASRIINVASYAGFASMPWSAAYNASKAGVISLTETLHVEWYRRNISVTVVMPGFFDSGLFDKAPIGDDAIRKAVERVVSKSRISSDDVAEAAIHGMEKSQLYVVFPAYARWLWRLKRLAPRWVLSRVARDAHRLVDRMKNS